jgi:hypothetical protein
MESSKSTAPVRPPWNKGKICRDRPLLDVKPPWFKTSSTGQSVSNRPEAANCGAQMATAKQAFIRSAAPWLEACKQEPNGTRPLASNSTLFQRAVP